MYLCYNIGMSGMAFEGQREGEQVELIFRRHVNTIWRGMLWLVVWFLIGLVPMLIQWGMLGGVEHNFESFTHVPQNYPTTFYIWLGCLVVGVLGFLYTYMLWHFSYYLVTNQRIRQVRQKGLFRKTVVDLGLDRIQSISYEVPGIWGGFFGYGTLLIQTQVGDMTISMVRRPEKTYNILQDLADKATR